MYESNVNIPKSVLRAFPVLSEAAFVRRFTLPDTTFDIFVTSSQKFLCLVTTDYPDPQHQSLELKSISGKHEFKFLNLLKPGETNAAVEILEHDDMEGDFLVYLSYKNYRLGYYVARCTGAR